MFCTHRLHAPWLPSDRPNRKVCPSPRGQPTSFAVDLRCLRLRRPQHKMNPPLRSEYDRKALVEALADGTVDAVTDHAPHAKDEKAKGFEDALE